MRKNLFIIIICIFFISIIVLFIVLNNENNFEIRIQAGFENVPVDEINNNFAEKIKDKLTGIEELKKIFIFSKENNCTIYCKINPFLINKKQIIAKIQRKIVFNNDDILYPDNIDFDDMYNKKYDTFLIISSNNVDSNFLNNYSEEVLDKLNQLRISSKIIKLGELKKAVYINFDDNTLLTYNLNLSDIKNIIKNNNSIRNSTQKNDELTYFPIKTDGNIKNIFDIGNIAISYKGKSFATKFYQVFNIEEKQKMPVDYLINFNDEQAQILAISKKEFCFNLIYQYKLKKLIKELNKNEYNVNLNLVKTSKLEKVEIYLKNNSSIYKTIELSKKINELINEKNIIYFVGCDIPKISKNEVFFENEKNKLVILSRKKDIEKIKNVLKDNNIDYFDKEYKKIYIFDYNINNLENKIIKIKDFLNKEKLILNYINKDTCKILGINYIIDPYSLNDISLSRKEIFDTILASNEGVISDYFFENSKKIPIILKNKNQSNRMFILNKNTKMLATIDSVTNTEIKNKYCAIARKNNEYFSTFYIKLKSNNPAEYIKLLNKIKNL